MLAVERRKQILEQVHKDKKVIVSELSRQFRVSEETIRRDLEKLAEDGHVIKSYGGAVINEIGSIDLPFNVRWKSNSIGKQKIADLIMLCLIHPVSSLPSVTPFWISSPLQEKNTLSALYCSMLSAAFTPRNDIESPFNIPPVEIISHSEISDNSSKFSIELVMTVSFFLFLIFFAIKTAVVDASRKICSPSCIS